MLGYGVLGSVGLHIRAKVVSRTGLAAIASQAFLEIFCRGLWSVNCRDQRVDGDDPRLGIPRPKKGGSVEMRCCGLS